MSHRRLLLSLLPTIAALVLSGTALAHCDSLDGPVVVDARQALAKGDPSPVLKWVTPANEKAVKEAFAKTLKVGKLSPEAKEMAETYFLETLVRLHREGEGFGYTGLKPAGHQDPAIVMADKAIDTGNIDTLLEAFSKHMGGEARKRFARVAEAKKHAGESVEKGREFVEAYVVFVHYIENLHNALAKGPAGHGATAGAAHEH